ncbi:hypothetical protein [uncultured Deinococcus sp.]|uniref:hypothetical protein n=1 Tax=uncultured Deinococcus sp. TaxID=158789 RepID=UPI0037499907
MRRVLWQVTLEDAASSWTVTLGVTRQGEAALLVGRDDRPALHAGTVEEVLTLAAASPDLPAAPDHALHDDPDLLFGTPRLDPARLSRAA